MFAKCPSLLYTLAKYRVSSFILCPLLPVLNYAASGFILDHRWFTLPYRMKPVLRHQNPGRRTPTSPLRPHNHVSLHKHHSPLAKSHTSFWEKFIFTTLCSDWYHSLGLSNTFSSRLRSYLPNSALLPKRLSYLSSLLFFCMSLTSNVFLAILSVSYSLLFVFTNSWPYCKFLCGRGLVLFTLSFPSFLQLQFLIVNVSDKCCLISVC